MLASPYSEVVRYERVALHDVTAAGDGRATWVDVVGSKDKAVRRNVGVLRFLGSVHIAEGTWAGIELQSALVTGNLNDGSMDGVRYFTCSAGNQALFVNVKWVRKSFLQKSPLLVKLGGRSTPRPRSSLLLLPHHSPLPSLHDHIPPRVYDTLADFLQLDSSSTSFSANNKALDTAAGIVHDLTYVTTRADKSKQEKQIREQQEEEKRIREAREREVERKRPLELVAEKARQALRASTPRLPERVINSENTHKYTYDNNGRRVLSSSSSPTPITPTASSLHRTAVAGMRRSTPISSSSSSRARPSLPSSLPPNSPQPPLQKEGSRPSSAGPRSSMDIKLPILTSRRQEGTVHCHRPQTRILGDDYVPPAFRSVETQVPTAAVAPSTMIPTLHSSVVTAITMASRKEKEERVPRRAPLQASDGQAVDLVEESLKLLGRIGKKQKKSCHSAYFQGAQDYLEGMAGAKG